MNDDRSSAKRSSTTLPMNKSSMSTLGKRRNTQGIEFISMRNCRTPQHVMSKSPLGQALEKIGLQIGVNTGKNLNHLISVRGDNSGSISAYNSFVKNNNPKKKSRDTKSDISSTSNSSKKRRQNKMQSKMSKKNKTSHGTAVEK